jgi:hypothetical protein
LRRALQLIALGLAIFAGLAVLAIHRRLVPRGPGVVTSIAADFSLPDDTGKVVPLASLLAHGPAVLVFYRGYW